MNNKIILFDGVCNFCNYWVNFIIRRDNNDIFNFAALQSKAGQELLKKFKLPTNEFDTFILIEGEVYFTKSDAAIIISQSLKGWPKILSVGKILPKKFRDLLYDIIAKNRYKIFGKKDYCRIPSEEEKAKFLE
uniref:Thiol-disulfide oxidoreductase DCC family protein n=1 Tax=Ignavibacterium album TaxID=591197 RepID=A0A7V2ZIY3_9BACT